MTSKTKTPCPECNAKTVDTGRDPVVRWHRGQDEVQSDAKEYRCTAPDCRQRFLVVLEDQADDRTFCDAYAAAEWLTEDWDNWPDPEYDG
jgi:hypothetical protein